MNHSRIVLLAHSAVPKHAQYKGSGDSEDVNSFECR